MNPRPTDEQQADTITLEGRVAIIKAYRQHVDWLANQLAASQQREKGLREWIVSQGFAEWEVDKALAKLDAPVEERDG